MRVVDPNELPRQPTTRDDWIELSDGRRLFSRTVLPVDAASESVPAVLEYLPYGPTDGAAYTDATHHPYFAGHGYASIRRGHARVRQLGMSTSLGSRRTRAR